NVTMPPTRSARPMPPKQRGCAAAPTQPSSTTLPRMGRHCSVGGNRPSNTRRPFSARTPQHAPSVPWHAARSGLATASKIPQRIACQIAHATPIRRTVDITVDGVSPNNVLCHRAPIGRGGGGCDIAAMLALFELDSRVHDAHDERGQEVEHE